MNVYLISNESYRLIEEAVKKVVKDNTYLTFNMNKMTVSEVIEEARYSSFDSEIKYMLINNAFIFSSGKIDEKDSDILLEYLEHQNPKTVIIFTTTSKVDSRKKIVKAIPKENQVITPPMDKRAINNLINNYVKDKGFRMDYQTINYIMSNSYNNIDIMLNELDKIMLYYNKPGEMKYNDVVKIVGREVDNNNFHFISAVIDKNLGLALKLLKDLKVYKTDETSLIILLAREYRLMYYVASLYKKIGLNEVMAYLGLQDWQVNKLYTNSQKFQKDELLNNLELLSKIDVNIKKGLFDKEIALYSFLLEACS